MANFFRQPDRRQRFLLPIDMMDWLPKDDIVHLIVAAVDVMNLCALRSTTRALLDAADNDGWSVSEMRAAILRRDGR